MVNSVDPSSPLTKIVNNYMKVCETVIDQSKQQIISVLLNSPVFLDDPVGKSRKKYQGQKSWFFFPGDRAKKFSYRLYHTGA